MVRGGTGRDGPRSRMDETGRVPCAIACRRRRVYAIASPIASRRRRTRRPSRRSVARGSTRRRVRCRRRRRRPPSPPRRRLRQSRRSRPRRRRVAARHLLGSSLRRVPRDSNRSRRTGTIPRRGSRRRRCDTEPSATRRATRTTSRPRRGSPLARRRRSPRRRFRRRRGLRIRRPSSETRARPSRGRSPLRSVVRPMVNWTRFARDSRAPRANALRRWRTPPLRRVPRPNLSSETTFDLLGVLCARERPCSAGCGDADGGASTCRRTRSEDGSVKRRREGERAGTNTSENIRERKSDAQVDL